MVFGSFCRFRGKVHNGRVRNTSEVTDSRKKLLTFCTN
nr:MAG TPA: hypothetical protein [Caudoviricetes sp.]